MMKRLQDQRGFSLVELIIVMGIMGIFAGAIAGTMGYLNSGRTKKASNKLDTKLDYIQSETMTKEGNTYLYIYVKSDGVYTCILNEKTSGTAGGFQSRSDLNNYSGLADVEGKLCDSKVEIISSKSGSSGSSLTLDTNNMLKIGYSKSTGAFTYSNDGDPVHTDFYDNIELTGKETFKIKLVQKTGKHFISKV